MNQRLLLPAKAFSRGRRRQRWGGGAGALICQPPSDPPRLCFGRASQGCFQEERPPSHAREPRPVSSLQPEGGEERIGLGSAFPRGGRATQQSPQGGKKREEVTLSSLKRGGSHPLNAEQSLVGISFVAGRRAPSVLMDGGWGDLKGEGGARGKLRRGAQLLHLPNRLEGLSAFHLSQSFLKRNLACFYPYGRPPPLKGKRAIETGGRS